MFRKKIYNNLKDKNSQYLSLIGTLLILLSGSALILLCFFPCDPNCINISLIGIIHGYLANIAQFSLLFSPLFLYQIFKNDSRWKNYWFLSLIIFIFGLIFIIISITNIFENHIGLLQRITFGLPLIWIEIVAIKLFRLSY